MAIGPEYMERNEARVLSAIEKEIDEALVSATRRYNGGFLVSVNVPSMLRHLVAARYLKAGWANVEFHEARIPDVSSVEFFDGKVK